MSKKYNISIIGAGNVGWHLAQDLEAAGHTILEVFSKELENAKRLAGHLYEAEARADLNFSDSKAEVFIICVKDQAIAELATELELPLHAYVAHTSGTMDLNLLQKFENRGVFYPLQSFSEGRSINFEEVPICIEAFNNETETVLTEVAVSLTKYIHYLPSEKRKILHLGAVFASNFTNHMLVIAKDILENKGVKFEMLEALVKETVAKAFWADPEEMQTGPAVRKDTSVIRKHLELLNEDSVYKNIYDVISKSIINRHEEE